MSMDSAYNLANAVGPPYAIRHHQYGIAIFGAIPIQDFTMLAHLWENEYGYEVMDTLIAQQINAVAVVTTKDGSLAWRAELGIEDHERLTRKDGAAVTPDEWLCCGDTEIRAWPNH